MTDIVIVSGSLSHESRSDKVLHYLGSLEKEEALSVQYISVKEISPEVLLRAKFEDIEVKRVTTSLEGLL
ncbi:hypothetical protein [Oceanobacillus polygoni]|uniref:NAD(P)H-dependent FMN reductase n=1 Tax=Oceanobacillus polygoni TaxID=1235259 RepID=A0A9X1CJV6_9BACI|nr:NAD(P)H-dependent FMN reductase [Oceanobacillus polygoni]